MRIPEKGNPESIDFLAGEIETGFDELGKLPSRLERYANAHKRALENLSQIRSHIKKFNDLPENQFNDDGWGRSLNPTIRHIENVRDRLTECGNYLGFREYPTVGKVRLIAARFCMAHLLCPLCAIRRGSKMIESCVVRYNMIMSENPKLKMSMITFTVKNGDDLMERHNHLKKSFQRLTKRACDYKNKGTGYTEFSKVLGFVGSYEVTNKGNGWHPHLHLMVLHSKRIDAAILKAEWLEITKDSHVLRIDPARHPKDPGIDFLEVCKYALKFGDLTPEQNLQAYIALCGKRLIVTSGLFWGLKIPEKLTDDEIEGLPYFDRIYKYVVGSGYNLTDKKQLYGMIHHAESPMKIVELD